MAVEQIIRNLKNIIKRKNVGIITAFFILTALCAACGGKEEQKKPESMPSVSGAAGMGDHEAGASASGSSVSGTVVSETSVEKRTLLENKSCSYAEQISGGILTELWEDLSPEMAMQLTQDGLLASWNSVADSAGAFEKIEQVQYLEEDKYDIVLVTMRFQQNQGRSIRFVYNKEGRVAGIWFDLAQLSGEAVDPGTVGLWTEEDITIGREPYILKGKITLPEQEKAPVVILLAGDADADMDGSTGRDTAAPLRDLACGLAEQGIASVRFNRRSYEYAGTVAVEDGLYDTLFQDVWYAVDQMYNERRIDRERIFVLAMGRAADYMPAIVKKKAKRLSGAVMMAAKPVSVTENFYSKKEKAVTSDAAYFMGENSTFPLLMLQGEEDVKTTMDDFDSWKELWKGRSHIVYRSYQYLDHYFMNAFGQDDKKVSQSVIEDIAGWCAETEHK